ncbi:hypothetical protein FBU59_005043 [Linderina macrospora]|uniref:Uncharacterized protein n=1 Tax=Linderina macrospora TaxID=4868 RepID=A0ACC1J3P4_9FUNG|nr:hypothetical protein FBU59_005043 [Linderina macrospora]
MCGGTIITDQLILTAAHCFYDDTTLQVPRDLQIKVGYGSNDLRAVTFTTAKALSIHPQYDRRTNANDIAIVRVPNLPLDGKLVDSVPIYSGTLFEETSFVSLGWGLTRAVQGSTSSLLKEGVVTIGKNQDCGEYLGGRAYAEFTSDGPQICTQNSLSLGNSPCFGDSGTGNIVYVGGKPHVIGITSFGSSASGESTCDTPDGFVIYTHVNAYMDFINMAINATKSL